MKLQHLPLPHLTPYLHASHLQDHLVRAFLASKPSAAFSSSSSPQPPPPPPTIVTFTPPPTYTCGRRDISRITPAQIAHLTAPTPHGQAEFHEALRGGQTTYHGPGQLVAYPILDLKRHGLTARCYVNLLEEVVLRTCARYGVRGMRTENPGVWTARSEGREKICAVGVHLRRNVSAHGVGLNVGREPLAWLGRIVACGLEGKGAACLEGEGVQGASVEEVGRVFVEEFAGVLDGVDGFNVVKEADVTGKYAG